MKGRTLTPAERTERLEQAHGELVEAVRRLTTDAEWLAYLRFQARFHSYSTGSSAISERCEFLWTTVPGALRQC
jgi:hypothetical protein